MIVASVAGLCSGCGGSSSTSSNPTAATTAGASAGTQSVSSHGLHGSPVVIAFNAGLSSTQASNYPESVVGAKLAADEINAAGGINGHPVQISVCDDGAGIPAEALCARNAVSAHAVMAITYNTCAACSYPIFRNANIAQLSYVPDNDPVNKPYMKGWVFALNADGFSSFIGAPNYAKQHGLTKVATAVVDVSAALEEAPPVEQAAHANGVDYVGTFKVPITVSDPIATAEQLKSSGAQVVVLELGLAEWAPIVKASASLGYYPIWVHNCVAVGTPQLEQLPSSEADRFIVGCPLPPTTDTAIPVLAHYVSLLKQSNQYTAENLRFNGVNVYVMIHTIANIAKSIKGPVTGTTVQQAFEAAKDVNIFNLYTWTPSTPGPPGLPELSVAPTYWTSAAHFSSTHQLALVSSTSFDALQALVGK